MRQRPWGYHQATGPAPAPPVRGRRVRPPWLFCTGCRAPPIGSAAASCRPCRGCSPPSTPTSSSPAPTPSTSSPHPTPPPMACPWPRASWRSCAWPPCASPTPAAPPHPLAARPPRGRHHLPLPVRPRLLAEGGGRHLVTLTTTASSRTRHRDQAPRRRDREHLPELRGAALPPHLRLALRLPGLRLRHHRRRRAPADAPHRPGAHPTLRQVAPAR